MWEIPYGLGSYSNPVEQPSSAWPTDPETPEPYSSPSQQYVDDLDDFFYGDDNTDLYETGLQEYGEITVTNASGSTSYSTQVAFYAALQGGFLGNEGAGSELTVAEKESLSLGLSDWTDTDVQYSENHTSSEGKNRFDNLLLENVPAKIMAVNPQVGAVLLVPKRVEKLLSPYESTVKKLVGGFPAMGRLGLLSDIRALLKNGECSGEYYKHGNSVDVFCKATSKNFVFIQKSHNS